MHFPKLTSNVSVHLHKERVLAQPTTQEQRGDVMSCSLHSIQNMSCSQLQKGGKKQNQMSTGEKPQEQNYTCMEKMSLPKPSLCFVQQHLKIQLSKEVSILKPKSKTNRTKIMEQKENSK